MNMIIKDKFNSETLSIYGSHDASCVFVDKDDKLRVFEYERFAQIRYAMYSDRFDHRSIGTNQKIRKQFLEYIKTQVKNIPKKIVYNELSETDLDLIRSVFPSSNLENYNKHHLSHATCGYYQSPFDDALIFTIDGGGIDDNCVNTTKLFHGTGEVIEHIENINIDLGTAYGLIGVPISEIKPGEDIENDLNCISLVYAGKVMGICAYGDVVKEWIEPVSKFYLHHNLNKLGEEIGLDLKYNSLSGKNSYDLAATSQHVFETILFDIILSYFEKNKTNIVISGGCGLNVLFNQKLKEYLNSFGYDLYVPPNPNDCGLALGQYLLDHKHHITPLVYSGIGILDEFELKPYLNNSNYSFEECSIDKIYNLISLGKIGGIISGHSEVGPRALGNRSIICDPSILDMKDTLNLKVKFREWYRPFAPVCRDEDKNEYFEKAFSSDYMSYAPLVKEKYRDKLPSITHIDNSARLQTVTQNQHKLFYDLLSFMNIKNKIPVILNTSFNIKGKPILTKIEDAFYVLDTTKLDFLVIENILVQKNE